MNTSEQVEEQAEAAIETQKPLLLRDNSNLTLNSVEPLLFLQGLTPAFLTILSTRERLQLEKELQAVIDQWHRMKSRF